MVFVDQDRGLVELEFKSDEIASFIGDHHHAIRARLRGDDERGDNKALEPFEGKQVAIGVRPTAPRRMSRSS